MLKKWLHILVSAWLINSLICFHPCDQTFTDHRAAGDVENFAPANTIVDVLLSHWGDDCDGHLHHRINSHARYVGSRSVLLNVHLPTITHFHFADAGKMVHALFPRFWENLAFLPPHHHFLFRLSPF